MKPKVSVIIPVFQVERYLEQGMASVRNQTLREIEIICVDDGSRDHCPEILDRIAEEDSRIKVIHNKNHGYGYSINRGFAEATGEYLAIFEPDDLLPSDALEKLYRHAKAGSLDLVKGDYCQLWGNPAGQEMLIPTRLHADEKLYNHRLTAKDVPGLLMSQIINCSGIFRRSMIAENGITLSETPGASYQDISLFFPLMLYAKSVLLIHEQTYYYRIDNPNASTKDKGKLLMQEEEYTKAQNLIASMTNDQNLLAASWSARWRGALGTAVRIDPSLHKEFLKYIRPNVEQAYRQKLLQRKYCDAYQWHMLQQFMKNDEAFLEALSKANGEKRNLFRIGYRLRYDGLPDTIRFLQKKRRMKAFPLKQEA